MSTVSPNTIVTTIHRRVHPVPALTPDICDLLYFSIPRPRVAKQRKLYCTYVLLDIAPTTEAVECTAVLTVELTRCTFLTFLVSRGKKLIKKHIQRFRSRVTLPSSSSHREEKTHQLHTKTFSVFESVVAFIQLKGRVREFANVAKGQKIGQKIGIRWAEALNHGQRQPIVADVATKRSSIRVINCPKYPASTGLRAPEKR